MGIIPWIKSEDFSIEIIDDNELDYYTNIKIILNINERQYQLFNDNILYLKNISNQHFKNINQYELDGVDAKNLGLLQNEYYYCVLEEKIIDSKKFVLDNDGNWIGSRYCCFESRDCYTWLYKVNDSIQLRVTPAYYKLLEDKPEFGLGRVIKEDNEILVSVITNEVLEELVRLIDKLYKKMI